MSQARNPTHFDVLVVTPSVPEAVYVADRVVVMSAAPGRIKKVIPVVLPHPKETTSADFRALEESIYELLDEEVRRTYAAEGRDRSAIVSG